MHIVKNSSKHIILIENTVVLILLFVCLKTNMFKFFKYMFLFICINFSANPESE